MTVVAPAAPGFGETIALPAEETERLYGAAKTEWREHRIQQVTDVSLGDHTDDRAFLLDWCDRPASEEARCRRLTRQIITDLVRSHPRGSRPRTAITRLARSLGVLA